MVTTLDANDKFANKVGYYLYSENFDLSIRGDVIPENYSIESKLFNGIGTKICSLFLRKKFALVYCTLEHCFDIVTKNPEFIDVFSSKNLIGEGPEIGESIIFRMKDYKVLYHNQNPLARPLVSVERLFIKFVNVAEHEQQYNI